MHRAHDVCCVGFFLGIPIEKQDDPAKVKGPFILKKLEDYGRTITSSRHSAQDKNGSYYLSLDSDLAGSNNHLAFLVHYLVLNLLVLEHAHSSGCSIGFDTESVPEMI